MFCLASNTEGQRLRNEGPPDNSVNLASLPALQRGNPARVVPEIHQSRETVRGILERLFRIGIRLIHGLGITDRLGLLLDQRIRRTPAF